MRLGVVMLALVAAGCPHRSPWPVDGEDDAAVDGADAAALPDARTVDAATAPDAWTVLDAAAEGCHGPSDCSLLGEYHVGGGLAGEWPAGAGEPFVHAILTYGHELCPGTSAITMDVGDSLALHDGDVGAYVFTTADEPEMGALAACMTDGLDELLDASVQIGPLDSSFGLRRPFARGGRARRR